MLELGKRQTLVVKRTAPQGIYLGPADTDEAVLLPKAEVPAGTRRGDALEVFLYKDAQARPIATRRMPAFSVGEAAVLPVASVTKAGAFLKWGLMKDLYLPRREMTRPLEVGETVAVLLTVDRTERLCATMKFYSHLSSEAPYQEDDDVSGYLYEIRENLGGLVAVDGKYHGLIPEREMLPGLLTGTEVSCRVAGVRRDGKLVLSLRQRAAAQRGSDAAVILEALRKAGGALPVGDHTDPEEIRARFFMSKAGFKRALGMLYKEGKIVFTDDGIALTEEKK